MQRIQSFLFFSHSNTCITRLDGSTGSAYIRRMRAALTKQQKGARATQAGADAAARELYRDIRRAWLDSGGNLAHAAELLNARRVLTPRRGRWYPASVSRAVCRLEKLKGRPIVRESDLNRVRQAQRSASKARYSEDGRRLRPYSALHEARKARRRRARQAQRAYREQHGTRLKARLHALYKAHTSARYVARDLNAEGFPAPPYTKRARWSASAVLREGPKVGAPWQHKYTEAQGRARWEDMRLKRALEKERELKQQGRDTEAARVLEDYFRSL